MARPPRLSASRSERSRTDRALVRSRAISLTVLPLRKCSRRIRPIVSTVSIPRRPLQTKAGSHQVRLQGVNFGRRSPGSGGQNCTPNDIYEARSDHATKRDLVEQTPLPDLPPFSLRKAKHQGEAVVREAALAMARRQTEKFLESRNCVPHRTRYQGGCRPHLRSPVNRFSEASCEQRRQQRTGPR